MPKDLKERLYLIIPLLSAAMMTSAQIHSLPDNITIEEVATSSTVTMPQIWTFDDCINWAIANNNDIRRTLLNILEADENIGMAKDAWLPNVGFSMNHNFSNYAFPENRQNNNIYGSSYGINASWTIWEGNVRKYRTESAKIMKQQQLLAGDDLVKDLKLGILQAYLNILYAEEAVEIARQSLEVSTAQAERAKKLMESGRTSKVDYAQIESQKAQDDYNLVQAKTNLATAKMNMKKILNLDLGANIEVATPDFPDDAVSMTLPTMEDVFETASKWLPQLKSNELSKNLYDNDIKIAKASALPNISLNGGIGSGYTSGGGAAWGNQMKHGLNENVGINFTVPIYDGNATRRAVAIAKLQAIDYDLNRTDLINNLSQTIESLYIESDNARAKYESGITQLEATTITAELVDRQFELGLVNPLDLLTAHNNLLNARLEQLQSKYMAILSNKTINYYATQQVALP